MLNIRQDNGQGVLLFERIAIVDQTNCGIIPHVNLHVCCLKMLIAA